MVVCGLPSGPGVEGRCLPIYAGLMEVVRVVMVLGVGGACGTGLHRSVGGEATHNLSSSGLAPGFLREASRLTLES